MQVTPILKNPFVGCMVSHLPSASAASVLNAAGELGSVYFESPTRKKTISNRFFDFQQSVYDVSCL